jgi:hypothetical protein
MRKYCPTQQGASLSFPDLMDALLVSVKFNAQALKS